MRDSGPTTRASKTASAAHRTWTARYGARHRWRRLIDFPSGITPPAKVRVYLRAGRFVLNWWDPTERKNLSERVDGDLLAALIRARAIDDRVTATRTAGTGKVKRIGHVELVDRYLADLTQRADAGEIGVKSVGRYRSALGHYLAFCDRASVIKTYPTAGHANRDFRLALTAFLADRRVGGNGHVEATLRPMRGQRFILDTVRGLFEWAIDPARGGLLPDGFRSPFRQSGEARTVFRGDPLAEPDVTLAMATDFVRACDEYELRLFVPLVLFGLRAAEPCFLFREHVQSDWLLVPNIPGLEYQTKGRRDKRFPLASALDSFWDKLRGPSSVGLLYVRRAVAEGREKPPLVGLPLAELIAEYDRRTDVKTERDRRVRLRVRDQVLRDAGGLRYDAIGATFRAVADRLGWPRNATLKDFRHLFATTLANAALPEGYRKYLMGHAPGRDAVVAYTHLNQLREKFEEVVRTEWKPIVEAMQSRVSGH